MDDSDYLSGTSATRDGASEYALTLAALRAEFEEGTPSCVTNLRRRAAAADRLVLRLWQEQVRTEPRLASGIGVLAIGGYGRAELFPSSDLDLLFLIREPSMEGAAKNAIREMSQQLWDSGNRVTATTRRLAECSVFDRDNVEFTLSLLDARPIGGDASLERYLQTSVVPAVLRRERKAISQRLVELKQERYAKFGNTLFHLEPNVKECPGGLRDTNVCGWLSRLSEHTGTVPSLEFATAFEFLASVRSFLHLRASRDNNVLDWRSQDEAAQRGIGLAAKSPARDAAGWMQLYFRHARIIARRLEQQMDAVPDGRLVMRLPAALRRSRGTPSLSLRVEDGRILLLQHAKAMEPETVLEVFEAVAGSGARPDSSLEAAIEGALPMLSAQMEEGAELWKRFSRILLGSFAGKALRSMHSMGVLELIVPEFHGIDALVVRDAYHRYTVDEHTFVLIDSLHALQTPVEGALAEWARRFSSTLDEVDRPELLYLAALLHDAGKGRSVEHTPESVRLAEGVVRRLEMDSYESGLVLNLIRNHLEMSATLRRDIFDAETVRSFAAKIETPEALRMLALFTYADIQAVHPDALSPWKAENLWRLYMAASNFLDRNIDEERVDSRISSDLLQRVSALLPGEARELLRFLEGFPQRYLRTRSPEHIRSHFLMSKHLPQMPVQLELQWRVAESEITLVTPDQRLLFARVAGVLSGWGMNILSADAFSNATGIVVDSFRFADTFKTLERNPGERDRLLDDLRLALVDEAVADRMIQGRKRRARRQPLVVVETSLTFDTSASPNATVLQVVAQDHPGLLYAISSALGEAQCSIEVAVIDTEGDTAIDVFYLKREGKSLTSVMIEDLRQRLLVAIRMESE